MNTTPAARLGNGTGGRIKSDTLQFQNKPLNLPDNPVAKDMERKEVQAQASFRYAGREYRCLVGCSVFKEGGNYIAHSKALDLSSSGGTAEEATVNFQEAFMLYMEACIDRKTLFDDLKAHGWQIFCEGDKTIARLDTPAHTETQQIIETRPWNG